jgi:hypothetical protein
MHILLSSGFVQTNQLLLGGFSETNQRLSSGFIETNERLTDLQLSNILDFVASVPIPEPSKSLNWCLSMTRRRQLKQSFAPQEYHWLIPKLQDWSKASSSSLVMVRGGFQFRLDMKDLAAELAECLRNAGVQVIWILKTVDQMAEDPEQLSAVDILKYLTSQILRLPETKVTEAVMNLACVRIKSAETEDDWLLILGSVLANLNRVYIVLDIEVLNYDSSSVGADFWPREFVKIFQKLRERDLKTLVKVVLISYGSAVSFPGSTDMDWESYVSIVRAPVLQMKRFRNVRSSRGRISQFAMRGDQRRWTQRLEAHL